MTPPKPEKVFPHLLYETLADRNPQKTLAKRVEELNGFLFKVVRDTALLDAVKEYGSPIDFARFEPYQNEDTAEYQYLRLNKEGLLVVTGKKIEVVNRMCQDPSGIVYLLRMDSSRDNPDMHQIILAEFMNQDHIITASQVYYSLEKEIMGVVNQTLL